MADDSKHENSVFGVTITLIDRATIEYFRTNLSLESNTFP